MSNCLINPISCAGKAAGSVASSVFNSVAKAFAEGLADVMKTLMTFWINIPAPDISQGSAVISTLDQLTRPLVALGAVVGLVVGGVRLVWTARHEQPSQAILRGLLLMVVVTAAGATIVEVLLTGFDTLAKAVLTEGFDGHSIADRLSSLGMASGLGAALMFILAFFGMIASLIQVMIMLIRGAILAVLVGILPVAAGASITESGYSWFKRLCGWIFSFTIYKLTAAIVYAAAFTMIGKAADLVGMVSGFALLILAILVLPALMRLLPPAADAMGSAGGGGLLGGAVAAAATGAVLLSSKSSHSAAPAATTTPGLKHDQGPDGPSGSDGTPGRPALPPGGSGTGVATTTTTGSQAGAGATASSGGAAGAAAGGGAAGGAAAAGGGAAAGGPVGAGVLVAQKAYSAAKSTANGAVADGGGAQ